VSSWYSESKFSWTLASEDALVEARSATEPRRVRSKINRTGSTKTMLAPTVDPEKLNNWWWKIDE